MTLRNDATRLRIVAKDQRRLRAVVARQGQALLDTDLDQQSRHHLERLEIETVDSLGSPLRFVYPAGDPGFRITPSGAAANFDIGVGHGYLRGWLLENTAVCKLTTQPHPRTGDTVPAGSIIAVKTLVRHIDPIEEPVLADVALGDAQASGRSLVDWQVFPLAVTGGPTPVTCANSLTQPDWIKLSAPSTGLLAVTAQATASSTDPCSLTPGGGYTRLENLLYRIEVHDGVANPAQPTIDGPRFDLHDLKLKVSRRNASQMAVITGVGVEMTVSPPALDPRNWFAPGLYAEIVSTHDDVDPRAALAKPRLFRVAKATDEKVTLEATPAQITDTGAAANGTWFLRLWDAQPNGDGLITVSAPANAATSAEIDLGDGLTLKLGAGLFRRGDYWTFAARADGSIDWPKTGAVGDSMKPHGPEIRYAPLAVVQGGASVTYEDCRIPFASLTDRSLFYRGGDGQSIMPPAAAGMIELPGRLRVAVMRGETPVASAPVRWSYLGPAGGSCLINGVVCNAVTPCDLLTGPDGLLEVAWSIDTTKPHDIRRVQAAIATGPGTAITPPLAFTATFETAKQTAYEPGACSHLNGVHDVQTALDTLCAKIAEPPKTLTLKQIRLRGPKDMIELIEEDKKDQRELILNGLETPFDSIVGGILFGFDGGPPDSEIIDFDPIVEVELDLPYPITDPDRLYWVSAVGVPGTSNPGMRGPFGFQRVRLDGTVKKIGKRGDVGGLVWLPSENAIRFLETTPIHVWGQRMDPDIAARLKKNGWEPDPVFRRVLCRIRLRSSLIWIEHKNNERIYLNAEHLGVRGSLTGRELLLASPDPQRAADLDIFIYLSLPQLKVKIETKNANTKKTEPKVEGKP